MPARRDGGRLRSGAAPVRTMRVALLSAVWLCSINGCASVDEDDWTPLDAIPGWTRSGDQGLVGTPQTSGLTYDRVLDRPIKAAPLLAQPGDIWPGPSTPPPTLDDVRDMLN